MQRFIAGSNRAVFLVTLLLIGSPAPAQDYRDRISTQPPAQRAAALTAAMKEKLSLSDAQVSRVQAINEQAANEVDEAVGALKRRDLRKQIKTINQSRDRSLREVLTPGQYSAWLEQKRSIMKALREQRSA